MTSKEEERGRHSPRPSPSEQLQNIEVVLALPSDYKQFVKDKRRRRREKERDSHGAYVAQSPASVQDTENLEEAPKKNGKRLKSTPVSRNPTMRTIGFILAMLEEKDRFGYFSMPEDLQTYNYEENVSRPGYFATLRQKLMDGIYASLEQFENDVLALFRKAVDSNPPNSRRYKEAVSLKAAAKHIFQSLRNNFTYTELELSNWHKNYYSQKRRAIGDNRNVGISIHSDGTSSRNFVSSDTKQSNGTPDVQANGRSQTSKRNNTSRRYSQPGFSSTPCSSKVEASLECPDEQRRSTYKPASVQNDSLFAMSIHDQLEPFIHNEKSSYLESLRLFVKDAGPAAKLIAEKKCMEYSQRTNPQPTWNLPPFGRLSKIGSLGQSSLGTSTPTSLSAFSDYAQSSKPFGVSNSSAFSKYAATCSSLNADTDGKQDLRFDSFIERTNVAQNAVGSMMPPNQITGAGNNCFEPQCQPAETHGLSGPNPGLIALASASTSSGGPHFQRGNRSFPWVPIDLNN